MSTDFPGQPLGPGDTISVAADYEYDFSRERLERIWELRVGIAFMHDVDYSLEAAMKMAMAEASARIRSTYYVRPRAEEYTLEAAVAFCFTVVNLGHRAGVHVDMGLPRHADPTIHLMRERAQDDIRMMSRAPVGYRVSLHQPPHACRYVDLGRPYENAVGPEWRGRYVADSRGVFRRDPLLAVAQHGTILLNLHPEWWFLPPDEAAAMREREAAKP